VNVKNKTCHTQKIARNQPALDFFNFFADRNQAAPPSPQLEDGRFLPSQLERFYSRDAILRYLREGRKNDSHRVKSLLLRVFLSSSALFPSFWCVFLFYERAEHMVVPVSNNPEVSRVQQMNTLPLLRFFARMSHYLSPLEITCKELIK